MNYRYSVILRAIRKKLCKEIHTKTINKDKILKYVFHIIFSSFVFSRRNKVKISTISSQKQKFPIHKCF